MFSLQRQVGPPDSTYPWLFRNSAANLFRLRLPPAANVKHLTVKLFPVSYSYLSGQIPSRRKNPKEELEEMRKDKDKEETNAQNVQLPIVGGLLFL